MQIGDRIIAGGQVREVVSLGEWRGGAAGREWSVPTLHTRAIDREDVTVEERELMSAAAELMRRMRASSSVLA